MMKALALLLLAASAHAAPYLYAEPYPLTNETAVQPSEAHMTINGGPAIACELIAVGSEGAKQPKCDLASITAPGQYTLLMTVNAPSYAAATSTPFGYSLAVQCMSAPVLKTTP